MLGEDRGAGTALGGQPAGEDEHDASVLAADAETPEIFHPVANAWPLLPEPEQLALAEDIKASGLRYPIWRHRDGRIIDGRNRWLACRRLGIDCPSQTYTGTDGAELIAFVVSLNDKRRHLTVDQRAAIAADLATLSHGSNQRERKQEASGEASSSSTALTDAEAAKLMSVSESSVERAKAVRRAAPTLHAEVKRGTLKAGKARAEVKRRSGATTKSKRTSATSVAFATGRATAGDRTTGSGLSGAELFKEITELRKQFDPDALKRLKELKSLNGLSDQRLELLDAHIDGEAGFLEGLRQIRDRLVADVARGLNESGRSVTSAPA
jgi:ParB-like chromosome segregation protein Spo0J